MPKGKPILCLDFDGVCHSYTSGWKGANVIPDMPVDGLFEFLHDAVQKFDVRIFSSRSNQPSGIGAMMAWFLRWAEELGQGTDYLKIVRQLTFPSEKPPAFVGIDDRVLTFTGKWPAIEELQAFKPWNKKQV
jgi:hypothetical protein